MCRIPILKITGSCTCNRSRTLSYCTLISNVNNYITSFITYYYNVAESSEMLCNVSNVFFFILCQVIITQNCNLVYYKRDYRKELRRRNEIGQITLITFSTFLYFYIMSMSVYMYCASFVADCCNYSQSREYKGCPMLNQNDFSDKIAIAFSVIKSVFHTSMS